MERILTRIFLLALVLVPATSSAATLYMSPSETELHPGDTIAVEVRIDTDDGECINVVDGVIHFTSNIAPVDISRGESIFPMWVEDPVINRNDNTITFAGGIPNGYCGRIDGDPELTNMIIEVILQAPGMAVGIGERDALAELSFADTTRVLLNDGNGTEADLSTLGSTIFVHEKPGGKLVDEWNSRVDDDVSPPSRFSISLERDETTFGGRYYIVFNTTDKESGLDHYEVIEEPISALDVFKFGGVNAPWKETRSPYLLEDQTLNSTIRVKAVDKAGNEYIATLVPDESIRGAVPESAASWALAIILGVCAFVLIGGAIFYVYRRNSRSPLERTEVGEETITNEDSYDV